jgi:hypothetical protein
MIEADKITLRNKINTTLDDAEKIWNQVGHEFVFERLKQKTVMMSEAKVETQIPGYPFLEDGKPKVDNFIALVLDIRNSTQHLLVARSQKPSQLERVFYETTAIYAMGAFCINKNKGGITEYLGDGFLALFQANSGKDVYQAHNAAKLCMDGREIVNEILASRYNLPELAIGIGLAYSKAIVTIVGTDNNLHPKVIGECVYRASKVSKGYNEIFFDEKIKLFWPSEKGGVLKFKEVAYKNSNEVKAFKAERNQ